MKLDISPQHLATLTTLRAEIAALQTAFETAQAAVDRVPTDRAALETDLAVLETATDYFDEKGVRALLLKRGQLDLLVRKTGAAESVVNEIPARMLDKLRELQAALASATRPALEQLTRQITDTLHPLHPAGQKARLEAEVSRTPRLISFTSFFHQPWATAAAFAMGASTLALSRLDILIAGGNPWSFATEAIVEK